MVCLTRHIIARSFNNACDTYDDASILQTTIATELLSRLSLLKIVPNVIVDLGAGTGKVTQQLAQHYPNAHLLGIDLALLPLQKAAARCYPVVADFIRADAAQLPLADNSVDFIFSNATLQWCGDLTALFAELQRVLAPGGLFMFTTFGPDTLSELRNSWQQVDNYTHVNTFQDMHDVGDALVHNRFVNPVMDVDYYTLTYASVMDLLYDLRAIGSHNTHSTQAPGLTSRSQLQQLQQAYEQYRINADLPATYEVIFGHAFTSEPSMTAAEKPSLQRRQHRVSIDQILAYQKQRHAK